MEIIEMLNFITDIIFCWYIFNAVTFIFLNFLGEFIGIKIAINKNESAFRKFYICINFTYYLIKENI